MLERWNDDRMDALSAKVDGLGGQMEEGFKRVDAELREQRAELREQGMELREQRAELREQGKEMSAGFERMQLLMIQFCGALIVSLIGLFGVLASQL